MMMNLFDREMMSELMASIIAALQKQHNAHSLDLIRKTEDVERQLRSSEANSEHLRTMLQARIDADSKGKSGNG